MGAVKEDVIHLKNNSTFTFQAKVPIKSRKMNLFPYQYMKKTIVAIILLLNISVLIAQKENLSQVWPAMWIQSTTGSEKDFAVFHFRKTFSLDTIPESLFVCTSGDMRYQLFVNDLFVCQGSQTGDLRHWFYEENDIQKYLKTGKNVISATILNYGSRPPDARVSVQAGFLLAASDKKFHFLNTNNTWKAHYDCAYTQNLVDKSQISGYYGGGSRDNVDGNKYDWNFSKIDFDDSTWQNAGEIERAYAKSCMWAGRWKLTPRTLPYEKLTVQRFQKVRLSENANIPNVFPNNSADIIILPNQKAKFILDQGVETTAFPVLKVSGGKNATIKLIYSESPVIDLKTKDKGNRADIENKQFYGYFDKFISDGGSGRVYSTLWWRAFRYIVVEIETKDSPLVINDFHSVLSTYPFELKSKFSITGNEDKAVIDSIFSVGIRTSMLCAHETFVDCPYYEESQFEGDARIQMLVSYFSFGDKRLAENAIEQFSWSINDEGFLSARYPTNSLYYIPNFSIYWIGMLHDHLMYFDNQEFIRSKIHISRSIIQYFLNRQQKDGSVFKPDYHNFVDWTFPNGEARFDEKGISATADLYLLMALQWAIELEKVVGNEYFVHLYQSNIDQLSKTIRSKYWDPEKALFTDLEKNDKFISQHTNCLAILTGITTGVESQNVMKKVLAKEGMTEATLFWSFYVFEALQKCGLGDLYLDNLTVWKDVLKLGVTTWPETGVFSRSECHGWGASPNYHFFKINAGIESLAPGFKEIKIAPKFGKNSSIEARIPHCLGFVTLKCEKIGHSGIEAEIELPPSTKGIFEWNGRKTKLKEGKQTLKF